jgi:hypothetical protein
MASLVEIVTAQFVPYGASQLYTSQNVVTRIDKLTVANTGAGAATVSIWLVPNGASQGTSNNTTPNQSILAGQVYNGPNEYGHYLNAGDALWASASVANQLVILVAGTQVTN